MTPEDIIGAARQCLGAPFRHQGRLLGFGLDCAGVAIWVARHVGVSPIDVEGYGRTPKDGQIERALDSQPDLMRVADPADRQPGDLLLMRFATDPQHLAVFTGNSIIHAYESAGKCVEHILSPVWSRRIVRAYRFRGVA